MKYFKAIRAISLTATFTPGMIILLDGVLLRKWNWNGLETSFTFVSILLLQISVNVLNDFEDDQRGIDTLNSIGGSGVIQKKIISAETIKFMGLSSLIFSILLGLMPLIKMFQNFPLSTVSIFALSLIGSWGYSCKPFSFKYHALGDLVVFLLCGPLLTLGFSIAIFLNYNWNTLIYGILSGLASVAIVHANNLNDLESDQKNKIKTIAIKIGFDNSKKYFALTYLSIPLVSLISLSLNLIQFSFLMMMILFSVIILPLVKKVLKSNEPQNEQMNKIRFEAAQSHLMLGIFICIGIYLSKI